MCFNRWNNGQEEEDPNEVDAYGQEHGEVGEAHGDIVVFVRELLGITEARGRGVTEGLISNPCTLQHLVAVVGGIGVGVVVVSGQLVVRHDVEDKEGVGEAELQQRDEDSVAPFV